MGMKVGCANQKDMEVGWAVGTHPYIYSITLPNTLNKAKTSFPNVRSDELSNLV
jgi:hypothetical protein